MHNKPPKMPSASDWAIGIMTAIMFYALLVVTP